MKKLSTEEIAAAFRALVVGPITLSERTIRWTEWITVRVSRQYWENSLDSKFTERPVAHERTGYFLGEDEIHRESQFALSLLVAAYAEAPVLIARMHEIEKSPGWEWIDHVSREATLRDRLSEGLSQARTRLERTLAELSLELADAASTATWCVKQAEPHLSELAATKARESAGYVPHFGGWLHTSGSNGRARFWVVRQDGSLRDPDRDEFSRSHRRGDHSQWWNLVEPDELGLWWSKGSNASEHEFEVRKLPQSGMCTDAQLATVVQLEAELENEWRGRRGLASGRPSPSVGDGWGLHGKLPDPDSPFAVLGKLRK